MHYCIITLLHYLEQPEIIVRPHDLQVSTGTTAELSCRMNGDPLPEIVWLQNANTLTREILTGSNMQILPDGTLQITNIRLQDEGIYECLGRNEAGETRTQPVRVMVTDAFTMANNDENNNNNNNNENNIVYNEAWNEHEPEENGQHNHQPNPSQDNNIERNHRDDGHDSIHAIASNRRQSFVTVSNVTPLENGQLTGGHLANSDRATSLDDEMPHFVTVSPDNLVVGLNTDSVRLECGATGKPTPEIQWHFNGRLISQSSLSTRILANGSLIIEQPVPQMAGSYRCVAANRAGWIESTVQLEVKGIFIYHIYIYISYKC